MKLLLRIRRSLLGLVVVLGAVGAHAAPALQVVEIPLPSGVVLRAHWLAASGEGRHPAVLALHGCGGLYVKSGALSGRFLESAERLHAAGYAVLLPDSFGSRGVRNVCQTRYRDRDPGMKVDERAQDARAALAWLGAQPQVNASRIGVLGWSNGATTVLNLLEQRLAHPISNEPKIAGAAVFYPGCTPLLKRHAALEKVPLLMQLGALDDWTPPQPCVDYAHQLQAQVGSDVTLHVYEGSYHGFDGQAPVRLREDVPNGVSAHGVHQGGNPQSRTQSLAALDAFWSRVLATRTAP